MRRVVQRVQPVNSNYTVWRLGQQTFHDCLFEKLYGLTYSIFASDGSDSRLNVFCEVVAIFNASFVDLLRRHRDILAN